MRLGLGVCVRQRCVSRVLLGHCLADNLMASGFAKTDRGLQSADEGEKAPGAQNEARNSLELRACIL